MGFAKLLQCFHIFMNEKICLIFIKFIFKGSLNIWALRFIVHLQYISKYKFLNMYLN